MPAINISVPVSRVSEDNAKEDFQFLLNIAIYFIFYHDNVSMYYLDSV